jgi:hypothetical protein
VLICAFSCLCLVGFFSSLTSSSSSSSDSSFTTCFGFLLLFFFITISSSELDSLSDCIIIVFFFVFFSLFSISFCLNFVKLVSCSINNLAASIFLLVLAVSIFCNLFFLAPSKTAFCFSDKTFLGLSIIVFNCFC